MSQVNNDLVIANENLFRALFCGPIAILLIVFAERFFMSFELMLFKVIYVLLAFVLSLYAIAYAAYYTNEVYEGETESFIKNDNLFKALVCAPLSVVFWYFAENSIASSGSLFFNVIYVLLALYFTLGTLGYAAFYTNDSYDVKDHA